MPIAGSLGDLREQMVRQNSEHLGQLLSKISLKQRLAERITDEIAKKPKHDLEVVANVQDLAHAAFVNMPKPEPTVLKTPEPLIIHT